MTDIMSLIIGYYNAAVRIILPVIAVSLIICCTKLIFEGRRKPSMLAELILPNGTRFPIFSRECVIGRSKLCDISIQVPSISRRHAVLTLDGKGWRISDIGSSGGVSVNGRRINSPVYIPRGAAVSLAGTEFRLAENDYDADYDITEPEIPQRSARTSTAIILLSLFQLLTGISLVLHYYADMPMSVPICFGGLFVVQWIFFAVRRFRGIGIELLAFLLATVGLCVAASAVPSSLYKQFAAMVLGIIMYFVLSRILQNIELTMKLRYAVGIGALLLLGANLVLAESINGAKNWIRIGSITIQPSEFVKIAFIFAGCATLERLMTKRNSVLFVVFSCACIGPLFLMRDFGTASIFFIGMLIIAYMRSGDLKAMLLFSAAAVVGAAVIIAVKPYVAGRFATYLHAWDYASSSGYQQTRTMIAIASGGLFGVGGGNGNLDLVSAADTDLVFGIVSEEWGLIVAMCCVAVLVIFAVYSFKAASRARSAYYSIAACATSGMFLFQAALNIFGSTDMLPLTGVTFPFISNGGSSLAASFAMLAFISAAGERSDAR